MVADPQLEQANLAAVRQAIATHKGRLQRLQIQLLQLNYNYFFEARAAGNVLDHLEWTRVMAPWEEIEELCRAEGIEVELGKAW